ncbi:D-beta-hydroxybutyrate dehydrogenase, mitochondrial [Armadillidium nasatum]|uniref:D-beta-hydroxybutyrate dehydrogenase, mitochondrial n=1 Tax=Armadillidium nasatum TaxID=96803 RepID=A0A5N5SMV8_9CRUS|nr:D-beta-hydroxybutyrate dehydrogenase, mitochondrial [Armadillidium nasatum]
MFHWTVDKSAQILLIGTVSALIGLIIGTISAYCGFCLFLLLWGTGSGYYVVRAMQQISPIGKAVLVTGCDTGIGNQLALHLDKLGFRVFAGCLFANKGGEGATKLKENGSKKLHVIQLDVTSDEELQEARETIEKILPENECFWGVVNNAGLSTFGNLEWVPLSTVKRIADVNVFGMISVIKTFLPLIRKSKGRIVNSSSTLGRISAPMRSSYVASKFAVEGLSDCLRSEMKPLGIDVCIIEPGNFCAATGIFTPDSVEKIAENMWETMSEETQELCGKETYRNSVEIMKTFIVGGNTDVMPVLISMEEALTQKYPQPRYQSMDGLYKARIFVGTPLPGVGT